MKKLLIPLMAAVLQLLPLFACSQDADGNQFVDPNQPKIDSLLNAIKPDSPDSVKARNYYTISNITCNLDTSLKYASLSLDYCNETYSKYELLLTYDYNNIAFAYYMKDESRKALQYRLKSADIYHKLSDKRREAGTFVHIGNCYLDLNIKDSVFYYYNKAIVILTEIKDTAFLIDSYSNLGQIYGSMSLYDNAIENYQEALDYAVASKNDVQTACCYCYLGTAFSSKSDTLIDLAIDNLTKSVRLFESINTVRHYDVEGKHYAYFGLAQVYIKSAKLTGEKAYADSCYKYIRKASNYYLSVGSNSNYVDCQYCYVDYLVFNKRYREALDELLRLEKYLADEHITFIYASYYNNLYEVYKHLGDYRNALRCHEKYMEYKMAFVNDSTLNSIKDSEVERTRMLDSVNHHYETLRIEADHQHALQRQRSKTIAFLCVAIAFAFIFVVLFFYYKTLRENEENKLRRRTLEVERTLLRTQMNPHFIFNAMNSIQSFIISNNTGDAERYLSKFAKLIRMILDNSTRQAVLLCDELQSLRLYLDLEQVRFSGKFGYEIEVDDNVEDDLICVPPMLIQPFVENAILHGLMHKEGGGMIKIHLTDNGNSTLTCTITDNGIGRKAAAAYNSEHRDKSHKSIGMQLTRDRLQDLNSAVSPQFTCQITDLEDESGNALGTQVTIILPVVETEG